MTPKRIDSDSNAHSQSTRQLLSQNRIANLFVNHLFKLDGGATRLIVVTQAQPRGGAMFIASDSGDIRKPMTLLSERLSRDHWNSFSTDGEHHDALRSSPSIIHVIIAAK